MKKKIILAITGASGSLYAVQFLKLMQHLDVEIHGIISDAGRLVLQHELGLTPDDLNGFMEQWHAKDDFAAPMSSGSSKFDAMLVLPCTMGTLGAIANGITKNLVHRAADVILKEKKLIRRRVGDSVNLKDQSGLCCWLGAGFFSRLLQIHR